MVTVPGAVQEKWEFSVRDDSIARLISNSMGEVVSLTYDEHGTVPTSCFGDTKYFITGVQVIGR
jgi:hypothetical protein